MRQRAGESPRPRIVQTWPEFSALEAVWDSLLGSSGAGSAFLTWDWIEAWRTVHGGAAAPFALVCTDQRGDISGIAPLVVLHRSMVSKFVRVMRLVGDIGGDSNNLDIIARAGDEDAVIESVLSTLGSCTTAWDILELRHMPVESPVLQPLREGILKRGWIIREHRVPHLVIELPSSWPDFLARLSVKARWRIGRAGALAGRVCARREELAYFMDALFTLHAKRWTLLGQSGSFQDRARRRFYEQLAPRLLDRNLLEFDVLELDGTAVAAQFGFCYGDTYYGLSAGFDPTAARYSPGVVLTSQIIRRLIARGVRHYDCLHGDEPYKLRWAPRVSTYVHLTIVRPRSLGARYVALADAGGRYRARIRARFPTVWQYLKRARGRLPGSLP